MTKEPMNRYEIENATHRIHGYLFARPLESSARAFPRAKDECLKHMRRALDCVEMMTYERYVSALRPYMYSTRTQMADQTSDAGGCPERGFLTTEDVLAAPGAKENGTCRRV
jgi:hypothetical protein